MIRHCIKLFPAEATRPFRSPQSRRILCKAAAANRWLLVVLRRENAAHDAGRPLDVAERQTDAAEAGADAMTREIWRREGRPAREGGGMRAEVLL